MNNKQQGADDFIEELLGRAQASTSGANVLHESQPPFPAVLGASHDVQHNVLKGRQDSLSSQLTDDGNFLNEYFEMDAQTLRGVGNLDSGYPGVLFRGSPNDTADVDRNGEQGDNSENFASSLGSSANSELLSPSGSYYPQRLNSLDSHGYSQYLSSSLRSPSTSLRGNAHQSSSLRGQTLPKRARQSSLSSSIASTPVLEDGLVGSAASGVSNMTQEEKLRRRREFHNAVERRRRELIKTKIKELGKLVPPSLLNYNDEGKEVRLNKGIILRRTVDYLEYLKQVLEVQEHKKLQLQDKIISLEQRRREIEGHPHRPLTSGNHLTRQNPESPEQIIDGRAVPHILKEDPPQNDIRLPFSDDLQQFLSGNQMEQEDNTKLLFNAGTENHASFLLNFDS